MNALNPADQIFRSLLLDQFDEDITRPLTPAYLEDPRGNEIGIAGIVIAPRNVNEVSMIVRMCCENRVPIVPYGGGTGLVCGQIMPDGPIPVVLSLERMSKIRCILQDESVAIVEAGATLKFVQGVAEQAGLLFPLSLAAEGTCQIGGNLATNAGGVNVLRYGNMRDLCLGLEAVLPDGQIWHGLTRLHKDNTGFDLRNLLIGSEGALGVITAASLKLHPRPSSYATALMAVDNPAAALALLQKTKRICGDSVSAFELIQDTGFEFLSETMPELRLPFENPPPWTVLIDLGLQDEGGVGEELLMTVFEDGLESDLVHDGMIAQTGSQRTDFWNVREHIPEANRLVGAVASHDVSLPLSKIAEFIEEATLELQSLVPLRINCFGHMGDGNLHFNVFPPNGEAREGYTYLKSDVERIVYDLVAKFDGSFSAEHGIGRAKVSDLKRYADPAKLSAIEAIKRAIDPVGIMNPHVIVS